MNTNIIDIIGKRKDGGLDILTPFFFSIRFGEDLYKSDI